MEDDDNDNGVRSRDGDNTYNEKLAKFKSQQGFRITEAEQDILGRVCCILFFSLCLLKKQGFDLQICKHFKS